MRCLMEFGVELHPESPSAEPHRLAAALGGMRQPHGAVRQLRHPHAMPFLGRETWREPRENRRAPPFLRQFDGERADLRRLLRAAGAAKRIGQQLMPETEPEKGTREFAHEAADGAFFLDEPGMKIDIPDIHRAAKNQHGLEKLDRRKRVAALEIDDRQLRAGSRQMPQETAARIAMGMLKNENAHPLPLQRGGEKEKPRISPRLPVLVQASTALSL
jgi:hypothetical protein